MPTSPAVVATPADFVTEQVVAFGALGSVPTPVDASHPLPVADKPFGTATPIVPGTDQEAARALLIVCTAQGNVAIKLADDSSIVVPVATGLSVLPFAVKTVLTAGTTATASYANLR